mmetsp:Transcript_18140/g.20309  ORF Transcript_18140/g.20309 Transcript_18140/m.20309 type:complete len:260 (+) Transcript_18140:27-806(+)
MLARLARRALPSLGRAKFANSRMVGRMAGFQQWRAATTVASNAQAVQKECEEAGHLLPKFRAEKNDPDWIPDGSNYDNYLDYNMMNPDERADSTGRVFTYMALGGTRAVYSSLARLAVIKFIHSMSASADVMAFASIEVDVSKVEVGTATTVKWRGKPVFLRHRTQQEIDQAVADDDAQMIDPQTDAERFPDPKWVIVIGVCTHLGCVPLNKAGDYGGWFCPCHGSHYDTSARIRKGPAPLNLEIPDFTFISDTVVRVG